MVRRLLKAGHECVVFDQATKAKTSGGTHTMRNASGLRPRWSATMRPRSRGAGPDLVPREPAPPIEAELAQERRHGLLTVDVRLREWHLPRCGQRNVAQARGVHVQVQREQRYRLGEDRRDLGR